MTQMPLEGMPPEAFNLLFFANVTMELNRLLQVPLGNGPENRTQVDRALDLVMRRHNAGDYLGRDVHLLRMWALVMDLQQVEQRNPQVFNSLRRKLLDPDLGNFYGTRFEVGIAASLCRRQVRFEHRSKGGPDFVLGGAGDLGIECASLHFTDASKGSFALDKLQQVVTYKSGKDYANGARALALDMTNLQAASLDHGDGPVVDWANAEVIGAMANASAYGTLLLFWHKIEYDDAGKLTGLLSRYARADSSSITPDLLNFISSKFPGTEGTGSASWTVPYLT